MTEVATSVLRRYYDELMEPAFAPAELMTWDELDGALHEPGTRGTLLLDDGSPVAGLVTEDYVDAALLLVAYVVVSPRHRGQGLGTTLLRETVGSEPRPVLAEIEDPRFHGADAAPRRPGSAGPVLRAARQPPARHPLHPALAATRFPARGGPAAHHDPVGASRQRSSTGPAQGLPRRVLRVLRGTRGRHERPVLPRAARLGPGPAAAHRPRPPPPGSTGPLPSDLGRGRACASPPGAKTPLPRGMPAHGGAWDPRPRSVGTAPARRST